MVTPASVVVALPGRAWPSSRTHCRGPAHRVSIDSAICCTADDVPSLYCDAKLSACGLRPHPTRRPVPERLSSSSSALGCTRQNNAVIKPVALLLGLRAHGAERVGEQQPYAFPSAEPALRPSAAPCRPCPVSREDEDESRGPRTPRTRISRTEPARCPAPPLPLRKEFFSERPSVTQIRSSERFEAA